MDLGSRNGTWVDGRRLGPGEQAALAAGGRLGFGRAASPWRLGAGEAPGPVAIRLSDRAVRGLRDGALSLPDAERVELELLPTDDGWQLEGPDGGLTPAMSGQLLDVAGEAWRLWLPGELASTVEADGGAVLLGESTLCFTVSRDEEHVDLRIEHPGGALPVAERAHHYLLLTLARLRLADAQLPPFEQGWVHHDDLQRMLDMSRLTINTQVSRARRALTAAGVEGAAQLVERRAGAGSLHIGLPPARLRIGP